MNAAEQEVLAICRSRKLPGIPCMRELPAHNPRAARGRCVVVDNARSDSPIVAQGADWEAVLAQLRARP